MMSQGGAERDWMIQVVKRRRFSDVLRRKNPMLPNDPLTHSVLDSLNADTGFDQVVLDVGR